MRKLSVTIAALCLAACGSARPGPASLDASDGQPAASAARPISDGKGLERALVEARQGVDDPGLGALLSQHWRWRLESEPTFATVLSVHAFDDKLKDNSVAAFAARRGQRREWLARAEAIDDSALSERDRLSLSLFRGQLEGSIASEACAFEQWNVGPRSNPLGRFGQLPDEHQVKTVTDGHNLVARYRQMAEAIQNEIELFRMGAKRGLFATRESTRRVLEMTRKVLAMPVAKWPLGKPMEAPHANFSPAELSAHRAALRDALEHLVRPALARYADFLRDVIMPKARPQDRSGLEALELPGSCYRARIRVHTTLSMPPEEVHMLGLSEGKRIDQEIAKLGAKLLGTSSLKETLSKLRTDPSLYFKSEAEVVRAAEEALAAAKGKVPRFFGIQPKAKCTVRRVPSYEAPYTTVGYYRAPAPDGSRPGEYFVNVFEPRSRPRFEARVLALHEAIPGHHLQIAISQELSAVPAFRKHGGITAYLEGWALYSERLGDEMGLYQSDLDRMGMLSFDAWRAGRLVVDTGIHALGWSRERAKAYLTAHTALAASNIDNEVDRYISWPGQALAYKIGQLKILELRRRAEAELESAFSLPDFHDAVLATGPVSLSSLAEQIDAYIRRMKKPSH